MTLVKDIINGSTANWIKLAGTLGVPSVIALFLTWALVTRFDARLDSQATEMTRHAVELSKAANLIEEIRRENDMRHADYLTVQAQEINLMRQVCINTSRNNTDLNACLATVIRNK